MAKVAVVGSSNTDMVVRVPHIPSPGETVLGGEFVMAAGGKGANQAVAAARLGAQVTLVARVGQDVFGERALAGFRQEGIATQYITVDPEAASGVALIFVDRSGENSIAVAPGANARLTPQDVQRAQKAIEAADVLLLQLETPLETVRQAAEIARHAGVRVVLNPAPAPPQPLPADLLALVDVLTPNEGEASLLAGRQIAQATTLTDAEAAARCLIEQGVKVVIVTLGARGALIVTSDFQQLVPGFAVDVVDTTAAGDAFNGGLAVALAEGQTLADAVRFANACGALAATKMGAQPSLPTAEEVARFLAARR
ncbi:MAG: ribokinase [Chloroflexi bacterium]|nr:ribokinase [Chloroflexota bacterium]